MSKTCQNRFHLTQRRWEQMRGDWEPQQDEEVLQPHAAQSIASLAAVVLGAAVRTWHSSRLRSTVLRIQEYALVPLAFDRIPSAVALTQRTELGVEELE